MVSPEASGPHMGDHRRQESLPGGEFFVQTLEGGPQFDWHTKQSILNLYKKCFTPIFESTVRKSKREKMLNAYVSHLSYQLLFSSTQVILLQQADTNTVIGFSTLYPMPISREIPVQKKERRNLRLSKQTYRDRNRFTLTVGPTLIDPDFRGKGGFSLIMNALEAAISNRHDFNDLHLCVRTENGLAERVLEKFPTEQIIYKAKLKGPFGPQQYLRIKR